jgi:amino acid adenylation domain-containing protein
MTSAVVGTLGVADDRPAVVEPGRGSVSYADLDRLAEKVADRLRALGVARGSRVGLYVHRSTDAIAAMLGTLRAGCAYVPVDPRAPVARIAEIHTDCRVHAAFVEERFEGAYRDALKGAGGEGTSILPLGPVGLGKAVEDWASGSRAEQVERRDEATLRPDLACLLYTSGTTGRPKGWMMSRQAVEAHVAWCHRFLAPTRDDVFANHAQFNFGMSLFDVYSSLGCGATLVLVPDEARQHAGRVADLMARERVSIWFSGPAILSLIAQMDGLESRDLSALRVLAFAGEVFPLPRLNLLRSRLPSPRYFNFYGSTETNVAAYYEIPGDAGLDAPPPIGRPCAHYEARVVGRDGEIAPPESPGELQLRGAGLTTGYWNEADSADSIAAPVDGGEPWFRTRDLVVPLPTGDFRYVGRIGRMIKLRGYRVEPGEVETRLYQHAQIKEVGVVPAEGPSGVQLVAHVSTATGERLSTVELKEFCAAKLPAYMIPERFEFHASLPRTSSGKIDLQFLHTARGAAPTR